MWEPGTPGAAPKCFTASLSLGPLRRSVLVPIYNILIRIAEDKPKILPVGARSTSWSRVRHFPPALTILALAVSVNLRAATVILGTSRSLISSVTVPTMTAILSL